MPARQPLIAVLGAGSWGTALAILLARHQNQVRMWGNLPEPVRQLNQDRENREFLPGVAFPDALSVTNDLAAAIEGVDEVLVVVPSHAFSSVMGQLRDISPKLASLSWATKGLEPGSRKLLHQVAADYFPGADIGLISGPTFAMEVARGLPTAITVASSHRAHADRLAEYLKGETFRAYTSPDIAGVQVGGAAKNVMAIAAGIADGLGFGANARAALITRGLAEITRLGLELGGQHDTFMGLAGLGDLVLTCTDNQSRNRRMGLALARGLSIKEAKMEIGQEVEGVAAARDFYLKSAELGVEMPITEQVYRILYESLEPKSAVHALLSRQQKAELD